MTKSPAGGKKDSDSGPGLPAPKGRITAWADDPLNPVLVSRPVPALTVGGFAMAIEGKAPKPGTHKPGSAAFRYWTAAEALNRSLEFWAPLLQPVTQWQGGVVSRVVV